MLEALKVLDVTDGVVKYRRQRAEDRHAVPLPAGAPQLLHELAVNLLQLLNGAARGAVCECLMKCVNGAFVDDGLLLRRGRRRSRIAERGWVARLVVEDVAQASSGVATGSVRSLR